MDTLPDIDVVRGFLGELVGPQAATDALTLAQLAAVAVTRQAWRDTHLENLHAGNHPSGGFPDAQMMRFNIATTRLVTDHLLAEPTDWEEVAAAVGDPERELPGGITVGKLTGDEHDELSEDIDSKLSTFADIEAGRGREYLHAMLACVAASTCREWYGTPWWSDLVGVFIERLEDPDSEGWRYVDRSRPEPASVADRTALRVALLAEPESLDDDAIDWCIGHGLSIAASDGLDRFRQRQARP